MINFISQDVPDLLLEGGSKMVVGKFIFLSTRVYVNLFETNLN
jgi:hypothetical protein